VASLRQVARPAQDNLSEQEKQLIARSFARKQPKGGSRHSQLQKFPVILRPEKLTIIEAGAGRFGAMSHQDQRASDSRQAKWAETSAPLADNSEVIPLSAARARATEEAAAAIARELNGPLTALMLYMNELKQQSHHFAQTSGNRVYLQQVVDNALQQTERVYAMVKQLSDGHVAAADPVDRAAGTSGPVGRIRERAGDIMLASNPDQKPLTRREREVLALISEGCSNKQGALRMRISPRTFESHRAEAMRKLGAKNTADLVRKALMLQPT
jgi:DNA-binding CsgD family transcriptional regulator